MEEETKEYRWETGYEKTWEEIKGDGDGLLEVSVQDIIRNARRKRLQDREGKTKLGMMRHLYLVIDLSQNMSNQDLKPTRLRCVLKLLEGFVEEFFYLNPISQLGIIVTSNKRADKVAEMTGNPRKHVETLKGLEDKECVGEPSLQNCLETVIQSLRNMPSHASREVLVVMGSLTTCDPGDIQHSITQAKELNIRCNVISLSAEVRIYRELAVQTGGKHAVILDDMHLKDLLAQHLDPPPSAEQVESSLIRMGFPSHAGRGESETGLGMCQCHLDVTGDDKAKSISTAGYLCPQCKAKYCELPVECRGCGLTLVSAPHLARSYHHLFPLPAFRELTPAACPPDQTNCTACGRRFQESVDKTVYSCPLCNSVVCADCDLFVHETLHTCPGCASRPAPNLPVGAINGANGFNGVS